MLTSSWQRTITTITGTTTDKVHYFTTFAKKHAAEEKHITILYQVNFITQNNNFYTITCFSCLIIPIPAPTAPPPHQKNTLKSK
jgi:hypothetical protein